MLYYHVDVFTPTALAGNGLTVVILDEFLESIKMQKIAQEFKQFETIFLVRREANLFDARIFTVEEELDFAGHPILGAAAVVHRNFFQTQGAAQIIFQLTQKQVQVDSLHTGSTYKCCMNQGLPEFIYTLNPAQYEKYLQPLNLNVANLSEDFPLEVISTGLPYLLVPITSGLEQARILTTDYEAKLAQIGAKFVYIFDINKLEGRTWDNLGLVEDVATGSSAGPVGAYLYKHNVFPETDVINLKQGSYVGRPSEIIIHRHPNTHDILVSSEVCIVVSGLFEMDIKK